MSSPGLSSYLSSVSEAGLEGLLVGVGELKGVPESVSLELSRWLLSREIRLELPPLELRFSSAMLCRRDIWTRGRRDEMKSETTAERWFTSEWYFLVLDAYEVAVLSSSSAPAREEGTGGAASSSHESPRSSSRPSTCWCCWLVCTLWGTMGYGAILRFSDYWDNKCKPFFPPFWLFLGTAAQDLEEIIFPNNSLCFYLLCVPDRWGAIQTRSLKQSTVTEKYNKLTFVYFHAAVYVFCHLLYFPEWQAVPLGTLHRLKTTLRLFANTLNTGLFKNCDFEIAETTSDHAPFFPPTVY